MHVRRWLETELGRGCVFMTGRLTQAVIAAMFSLAFSSASAEGNRPRGMYPIGGQGVQGCAPIPGASSGSSATIPTPPPRPLGEWVRTWAHSLAHPAVRRGAQLQVNPVSVLRRGPRFRIASRTVDVAGSSSPTRINVWLLSPRNWHPPVHSTPVRGPWRAPGSKPCVTVRQQAGRIARGSTRHVSRRSSASIKGCQAAFDCLMALEGRTLE